jgi:hypothetical protein
MAEKLLAPPEHEELLEAHATPDKPEHGPHAHSSRELHENHTHHEESPSDRIDEIRESLKAATSAEEVKQKLKESVNESRDDHAPAVSYAGRAKRVKKEAFDAEIKQVREHLSKRDRALSRAIHAEPVRVASEIGEKTIARPQALLYGGIFAALSSAALYVTAKYIGFSYNYLLSFLFFAGGYCLGLLVELLVRLLRGSSGSSLV